jgi:hypothetical protein
MSPAAKELAKRIVFGDKPLAAWIRDWQAVAKALGQVDAEKTKVEARAGDETGTPSDAVRARNAWIRTANALLTMLDLEQIATDADREAVRGPLDAALAKAARRGRTSAPKENEEPVAQPAEPTEPTDA